MGIDVVLILCLFHPIFSEANSSHNGSGSGKREIKDVNGGPNDVVWIVQLSDLHFSVHHPDRAIDFHKLIGPALSIINPSLVLITGDLTDGKSKDLLTMKQGKEEWEEYRKIMEDVIRQSGLSKSLFYDLRGNHDNFGVPTMGGSYDFFSTYSLSGQLGRSGLVNSVTVQTGERNHLFVAFDSTMSVGLRGPTNLFGHPTDQLLTEINSELSQWDSRWEKPLTKIAFGHFPLSFSAASDSGKTLKDIFLKHSISAYLCGHLHTRFGKNLKRHHELGHRLINSQNYFQLNTHEISSKSSKNCSNGAQQPFDEFWELEMGDWRKSRAMRILAIDRGYVSFLDTDFKMGAKKTLVLATYPLDSRFMSAELLHKYKCRSMEELSYGTIRALVFSAFTIVSVKVRIYDSRPGNLYAVMEATMTKHGDASSRGDLYTVPWNSKAFEDPSPDRFWLEIEAIDNMGKSTLTDLRPFSVNGVRANLSWTWKEFFVMGCQWAALYYPIFWSFYLFMFTLLLIPKAILALSKKQYTYRIFSSNKGFMSGVAWVSTEVYKIPLVWQFMVGYLFYLLLCPWLKGQVFIEGGDRGYMTYKGWVVKFNNMGKLHFIGFPDIMVVVLPHLFFVVLPVTLVIGAVAADRGMYQDHLLSLSGKKKDDHSLEDKASALGNYGTNRTSKFFQVRWTRNTLLLVSVAICWKHFKNCKALIKAYEMNPFVHFPMYSLSVPLLLAYVFYKTRSV